MVETHQLLGALRRAALAVTPAETAEAREHAASLLEDAGWSEAEEAVRAVLSEKSHGVSPRPCAEPPADIPFSVALSPDEYDVATILAFDPDADIAPGAFSRSGPGGRSCRLPRDAMPDRSWRKLARACSADHSADGDTILRTFLAARRASAA
mgnify:CR=1 FL=1